MEGQYAARIVSREEFLVDNVGICTLLGHEWCPITRAWMTSPDRETQESLHRYASTATFTELSFMAAKSRLPLGQQTVKFNEFIGCALNKIEWNIVMHSHIFHVCVYSNMKRQYVARVTSRKEFSVYFQTSKRNFFIRLYIKQFTTLSFLREKTTHSIDKSYYVEIMTVKQCAKHMFLR